MFWICSMLIRSKPLVLHVAQSQIFRFGFVQKQITTNDNVIRKSVARVFGAFVFFFGLLICHTDCFSFQLFVDVCICTCNSAYRKLFVHKLFYIVLLWYASVIRIETLSLINFPFYQWEHSSECFSNIKLVNHGTELALSAHLSAPENTVNVLLYWVQWIVPFLSNRICKNNSFHMKLMNDNFIVQFSLIPVFLYVKIEDYIFGWTNKKFSFHQFGLCVPLGTKFQRTKKLHPEFRCLHQFAGIKSELWFFSVSFLHVWRKKNVILQIFIYSLAWTQ